jgi:hypothetical protein
MGLLNWIDPNDRFQKWGFAMSTRDDTDAALCSTGSGHRPKVAMQRFG